MNPFKNRTAEAVGLKEEIKFRRTSGSSICPTCNKEYRRHPDTEHVDWNGDPFLKKLCNGDLVKL